MHRENGEFAVSRRLMTSESTIESRWSFYRIDARAHSLYTSMTKIYIRISSQMRIPRPRTRVSGIFYRAAYFASRPIFRSLFLFVRAGAHARFFPFSTLPDRIVPFVRRRVAQPLFRLVRHSISNFALAIRVIPRSFSLTESLAPFSPYLSSAKTRLSFLEYKANVRLHPCHLLASSLPRTSVQRAYSRFVFNVLGRHLLSDELLARGSQIRKRLYARKHPKNPCGLILKSVADILA